MKRNHFAIIASVVACLTMGSAFLFKNAINPFDLKATPTTYQISFNSSKNKFHSYTGNTAYDGAATIHTNLGNDVDFNYYQIKGISTTWHVLGAGGYFYNADPIHGLESIDLSFKTDNASYSIYYSYDDSFNSHRDFTSSSSTHQVFNFDDYYPNYFKVVNNSGSNFNISSIDITLNCLNNYPTLTVSSENETMGTVSGGGVKTAGQNVTIVATPNAGYRFVGWYDGESLISNDSSCSFTIGNDDLNYVARFTYQSYNLFVQSESNEKGTVSDSTGSYDYLSEVTIEAFANEGYTFSAWYENGSLVSTNNPYTFNMTSYNATYTAKFSTNSYNLVLNNLNPSLGYVWGDGTFQYKQNVTLTATPDTGVSFLGWYNTSDELVSSDNPYNFTMPYEDLEYNAKFEWTPYSVSLSVNDDTKGTVSGSGSYIYQQEVTLNAYPNQHCSFAGWYDNNNLVSMDNPYVFNLPNSSLSYEARFVQNYNIYIYSDDETMGTVSAPSEWGAGLEVTVNANQNDGYAIDYWYDDDLNEVSYDASYTFIMPEQDVTLYAAFATGYTLTLTSSDNSKGTVFGGGQYKAGRTVTATMNYISGTFKGWYDDGDNFITKDNPYSFTMPANDYSLEARFVTQEEEARKIALGITPSISNDGKTITYGLYPQKNVNDASLISALNSISTPESNGWYLYNDEYYAKLSASPYDSSYEFDNGTTIVSGTTYWFKCEPIVWNVLQNNAGQYYLLSSVLLDAHRYAASSNNYKNSEIRIWLNGDFYNSAFALGNNYIQTKIVNNSAATTNSSSNSYACTNTEDKVFLPSYQDYINSSYGFSTSKDSTDTRCCRTTDWARARGALYYTSSGSYQYNGDYWTRSPYSDYSRYAWYVYRDGYLGYIGVDTTYVSVRPGLSIKIA